MGAAGEGTAHRAPRMSTSPASRIVVLPVVDARWNLAVGEVERALRDWSLPTQLARGYLLGALDLLQRDGVLELYLEFDPVDDLMTVEVWDGDGTCVFGIDDYLGA